MTKEGRYLRGVYEPRDYWTTLHRSASGPLEAVGYQALGLGFNRATYRLRLSAARRLLSRTLTCRPWAVLEAGVGSGAYGSLWRELGAGRWIGADISEAAIERLRRSASWGEFVCCDLGADGAADVLRVAPASVPLVTAIDVLYHIVDDARFVQAVSLLAELVSPGGLVILSDVFVDRPVRLQEHVMRRPLGEYSRALGSSFAIVGREPVFAILGDPVVGGTHRNRARFLFQTWRLIQKLVRVTPRGPLRDLVGSALVRMASPVDSALRRAGWSEGVNLELAAFCRGS
jgi:2-polyprenyl-3-methyl-5-hydroxy-6-metoxy-1,4-benzoquinol methylase